MMATSPISPIRKKRNFKALQLSTPTSTTPAPIPEPEPMPIASRQAPIIAPPVAGKKRPPPMTLKAPKIPVREAAPVSPDPDSQLLTVSQTSNSAPNTASPSGRRTAYSTISSTIASLDMNSDTKFELKNEDLREIRELGQGNGGSVKQVIHVPTGTPMAKKTVLIDAKPSVRKQILRELQIMHDCHSKYIVSFWGAYLADPNICMCIELMDKGSLDSIYKKIGPIDIEIVGKVALAVVEGLTYLYDVHRIIHRDIKPSNILCNSSGAIKICDFGVSGELINSIADTFVGTSTYMSPERIQGAQYTVKSDVWSLGISLIELALGRFPFASSDSDDSELSDIADEFESTLVPSRPGSMASITALNTSPRRTRPKSSVKANKTKKDRRKSKGVSLQGGGMTMSILELLQHIVNEPAPRLTPERFPREAEQFVDGCLLKDPDMRKTPKELLKDIWIEQARVSTVDVRAWANSF